MTLDTGLLITLALFLLTHTGAFIWWGSKINTLVKLQGKQLQKLDELVDDTNIRLVKLEVGKVQVEAVGGKDGSSS